MALGVLMMSGCQQVNDLVNKPANTNTATNSNASANTNTNSNATANSNANANTSASPTNSSDNSNTSASSTAASPATAANIATTTKDGAPLSAEEKVFANNLIGNWSDAREKVVFTKDEITFTENGSKTTWTYAIVDEKNVEITDERGQKSKATMTFEENNTKLHWVDKMGDFRYKREVNKP